MRSLAFRSAVLSLLLLATTAAACGSWPPGRRRPWRRSHALTPEQIEYAKLMGKDPARHHGARRPSRASPRWCQMGDAIAHHLSSPFYDNGPNDKGLGLQLALFAGVAWAWAT